MSSRLSVIFYIILCFEIGLVLTALPWVPARMVGPERLGQQLLSVACFAQSWFRYSTVHCFRLGAGRRLRNRNFEFGHGRLGTAQFSQDRSRAGTRGFRV